MLILGIDPGRNGAVVLLDGLDVRHQERAMVYLAHAPKTDPDPAAFLALWARLREHGPIARAVIEAPAWYAPAGRTMNSGVAGRLGMEHMAWRMLLALHGVPYEVLAPRAWRRRAGVVVPVKGDPKAATIAHVGRLLPTLDLYPGRCKQPHDGLADAAGMCLAASGVFDG